MFVCWLNHNNYRWRRLPASGTLKTNIATFTGKGQLNRERLFSQAFFFATSPGVSGTPLDSTPSTASSINAPFVPSSIAPNPVHLNTENFLGRSQSKMYAMLMLRPNTGNAECISITHTTTSRATRSPDRNTSIACIHFERTIRHQRRTNNPRYDPWIANIFGSNTWGDVHGPFGTHINDGCVNETNHAERVTGNVVSWSIWETSTAPTRMYTALTLNQSRDKNVEISSHRHSGHFVFARMSESYRQIEYVPTTRCQKFRKTNWLRTSGSWHSHGHQGRRSHRAICE